MTENNLFARFALILAIVVLITSCVTEVSESPSARFTDTAVVSVYDDDTVITAGSSIAWQPDAVHYYEDERISGAGLRPLIEKEIVDNIKAKKMRFVDSVNGAQYAVAYTAALESSLDDGAIIRQYGLLPGNTRIPRNDANIEKGSLIIYVFNNKSGQVIWRSAAQTGVKFDMPAEQRKQRVIQVIEELFQSFPAAE